MSPALSSSIDQAFNAALDYYDGWMRTALPNYDDLFGSALRVIPFPAEATIDVLDLGAGTGLFSQHVLGRYPQARFVLYDVAEKLLEAARARFSAQAAPVDQAAQFEFVVGDYRALQAAGQFDLVISSLSIHHLEDDEKAALFRSIYRALRSPGVFINIDQVRGKTPALRELYWNDWLSQVRQRGAPEAQIEQSIERRRTYDRDATLADQLRWLAEAGFVNVDCVYKNFFVGVFLAMKA